MGRRAIFILAGLAAALSILAVAIVIVAFLTHPPQTASVGADAARGSGAQAASVFQAVATPAAETRIAATASPVAATPASPPAPASAQPAALIPAALPSAGPPPAAATATPIVTALVTAPPVATPPGPSYFRAILEQQGVNPGDRDDKFTGSAAWALVDGGADGQVVESRVTMPDRQWFVTVRLKKNNDATLPASHLAEISIAGPTGAPPPVAKVLAFRFKTSQEASPEQVTNVSQTIIDGLYWVALSDDPKNPKLPSLLRLPWIDILLEFPNGKRGVLSLEKGTEGNRVVDAALAAWNSPPTR